MLQDFAKSAERHKKSLSRKKPASGISNFRIIITLVLAVGFGLGLYSLSKVRPELAPEAAGIPEQTLDHPAECRTAKDSAVKPPFPFTLHTFLLGVSLGWHVPAPDYFA